jgi:thiamine pyrophosphate-dependent acetolactate synthase large subunit-like protein
MADGAQADGKGDVMAATAGDFLCERLAAWGVTTVYGFPGDGIMALASRLASRMASGEAMDDDPAARAGAGATAGRPGGTRERQ